LFANLLVASVVGAFPAAAIGQASDATPDVTGPPHESLGRAAERVHAVLCKLPDRREMEAQFRWQFDSRIEAVQVEVEREFGKEAANRSYISTLPCYRFRSGWRQDRALTTAVRAFEDELKRWEKRYKLRSFRRGG
jgi:hypothetical protein